MRFSKRRVIDLRTTDHRPTWGKPSRCPECGEPGYLDHIDLVAGFMRQHCPVCWHEWETLEIETAGAEVRA
jgi:hypothetical protein